MLALLAILSSVLVVKVQSHGYMFDPPGRSTAWRYGFGTKANYNDNQVNCGRASIQNCGVCGDPLDQFPGANTLGGTYGTGKLVKTYRTGQIIKVGVKITANHVGWFEFSLCKLRGGFRSCQSCFNPLISLNATRRPSATNFPRPETKWKLLKSDGAKDLKIDLKLPDDFECEHCVLRWLWNCGNDYGCFKDGRCGKGFGPIQEKFYSCADIAITKDGSEPITQPPKSTPTPKPTPTPMPTPSLMPSPTPTPTPTLTPSPTPTPTLTPTPTSSGAQGCGGQNGNIIPDPNDCCRFYYCLFPYTAKAQKRGFVCPNGTAWDVTEKFCDYFKNVDCGTRSKKCIGDGHSAIPKEKQSQKCTQDWLADPENCCGFLRCNQGRLVRQSCADGTAWDVDKKTCDFSSKVTCGRRDDSCLSGSVTGSGSTTKSPATKEPGETQKCFGKGERYADPETHCGYLLCLHRGTEHEKEVPKDCPCGTAWDDSAGNCHKIDTSCSCPDEHIKDNPVVVSYHIEEFFP